ncbi:family 78 glycoside hydrolase [Cryphonectria parasitica EP155]|uniref:alpha-L-rhamnosidase n=1 Tax=Cryphonectria parasitica (strain ATCC 38755 / EP155) TaxID=660469 RepID=A0A9P5CKK7_CRYP1|nr:family 78 glycoside hydrolase [Cryphonectria parasitica EP155]KAF3761076.1 family 78 glycoside hydrolase [Cryphonectria parasitica EP155]
MLEQLFVAADVRFEHHPDGFGIGTGLPRISWRYSSDGSGPRGNWLQRSYISEVQRLVSKAGGWELDGPLRTHVVSDQTIMAPWCGPELQSRQMALVRVIGANTASDFSPADERRLEQIFSSPTTLDLAEMMRRWTARFDNQEHAATAFSGWTPVEVGLLKASDWKARFITSTDPPPQDDSTPHHPMVYLKDFHCDLGDDYTHARLYISALGLYEVYINGQRVGDQHMTPGWTSYHHRLQYQTYDLTSLVHSGNNTIAVEVAEGWYAGRLLWVPGLRNLYGDTPAFIAQIEIHRDGGSIEQIVSDESWVCRTSPRQAASIYDGEVYDARAYMSPPGGGDHRRRRSSSSSSSNWKKTRVLDFDFDEVQLVSTDAPPVAITQHVSPTRVFKSPSGKTLVDFGQNLVGRVEVRGLQRPEGHTLTIRHAEVLEHDELCTRPLRDAKAVDTYIFSGAEDPDRMCHVPAFTFHGFRYIELDGWSLDDDDGPPSAQNITALVVGSHMPRTGYFSCSDDMVNKLHQNVSWGMRGNFLSVPTDCPQRDERLGWTGDIQAFAPTALFLYSSVGFLSNWLIDLSIDQATAGGCVPVVIPDVLRGRSAPNDEPVAVWDDAAILVPWAVYRWSGDVGVLHRQLASMKAHLHGSIRRGADGLWDDSLFQFGDWLDPNAPPDQADLARTDGTLVADAYLVHVTDVMAHVSVALGNAADARSYQAEFERLKTAFADKYISKKGLVVSDSQTGLSLVISFGLLADKAQLRAAGDRLERLVRQSKFKVSTGFAGTPLVLHALTRTGHVDLAYEMLLCKDCPSWLYPVTMGATTIWERWDSMLPDGTVNPGSMTSFNHYALGSVADWLHTVVGGIQPLEAGWKTFMVRPRLGGSDKLTRCEVAFDSPYGKVGCSWSVEEEGKGEEAEEETKERARARTRTRAEAAVVGGDRLFKMKVQIPPNCRALVVLPGQEENQGEWKGCGRYEIGCELK